MASQKLKWRKQLRHYSHKKTKAMKANELMIGNWAMTPTMISELPKELRELAEQRRSEHAEKYKAFFTIEEYENAKIQDVLVQAFMWGDSPENYSYWNEVELGNYEKVIALKVDE